MVAVPTGLPVLSVITTTPPANGAPAATVPDSTMRPLLEVLKPSSEMPVTFVAAEVSVEVTAAAIAMPLAIESDAEL